MKYTNLFLFKNLFHEQSGFRRHNDVIIVAIVRSLSLSQFLTWRLHLGTFSINIALRLNKNDSFRQKLRNNKLGIIKNILWFWFPTQPYFFCRPSWFFGCDQVCMLVYLASLYLFVACFIQWTLNISEARTSVIWPIRKVMPRWRIEVQQLTKVANSFNTIFLANCSTF